MSYRVLTEQEIQQLIAQHCTAEDWSQVQVKDGFDAQYVEDAHFSGPIRLGVFERSFELPGGVKVHSGIAPAESHRGLSLVRNLCPV